MAYVRKHILKRPDTETAFPEIKSYNSDYWDWRRQYYSDNNITVTYDLSGDELTLTQEMSMSDKSVWDAFNTADDARGDYASIKGSLNTAFADRNITIQIEEDDDGTGATLLTETNTLP
tara:strand:+ start:774 stop:1130 length:357 start_codon:yes stop_codon:yes gene_type:complete